MASLYAMCRSSNELHKFVLQIRKIAETLLPLKSFEILANMRRLQTFSNTTIFRAYFAYFDEESGWHEYASANLRAFRAISSDGRI